MLELWLIRHGETEGNRLGRYIGKRTDEPLSEKGRKHIQELSYPEQDGLFVSPMLRCRETAALLFPGQKQNHISDLMECDFGRFENKNYIELSGDPSYQAWIDSNGSMPFPEGESREQFRARCMRGLTEVIDVCEKQNWKKAAVVVHGGTIMHLMDAFASEVRDFYGWHVKNGGGYKVELDPQSWNRGDKVFHLKKSFLEG